ncbi:MAG: S4 domain-containing protein, partial [Candidatus Sungiibacteriota bacterium]
AFEIVKKFYGETRAQKAAKVFTARFSRKGTSDGAYEKRAALKGERVLIDLVMEFAGATSKSEARRLILGGAVELNHKIISDPNFPVELKGPAYMRIGKKKFLKIIPK